MMSRNGDAPAVHPARRRSAKSGAERQAEYRRRNEVLVRDVRALLAALAGACERGRCPRLTNRLPDELSECLPELTRRLENAKVIVARKDAR